MGRISATSHRVASGMLETTAGQGSCQAAAAPPPLPVAGSADGADGPAVAVGVACATIGVAAGVASTAVAVGAGPPSSGTDVAVGVRVAVAVGVGVAAVHTALDMLLVSSVTAPFRAKTLPDTLAPVFRVMLVSARIFPTNVVLVPSVAELPTCQNTLQRLPLLITLTDELLAVVSVLPILKTHTALALPPALRMSAPVNPADDEKQ